MEENILSGVWPEWEVVRRLGKGSFGVVYEAVRREHNLESRAAIKVISIPQDEKEADSLRAEGLSVDDTRTFFQGIVNEFVNEIQMMESFKGVQNIVSVEDYKVVEKANGIGWDIYIRMELLIPFNSYICDRTLTEPEVIKLGYDICSALELCAEKNIIHRDIKPENIFINSFGNFKLGDFGIARKLEDTTYASSVKGAYNYMAPEVEKGNQYDATVDIYSLGLVLYRLMNKNRMPFVDTEKQLLSPNERMKAIQRRLSGEKFPEPCDATYYMARVILYACAYNPKNRFQSAAVMKKALVAVAQKNNYELPSSLKLVVEPEKYLPEPEKNTSVRKQTSSQVEAPEEINEFGKKKKGKLFKKTALIAGILLLCGIVAGGVYVIPKLFDKDEGTVVVKKKDKDKDKDKDKENAPSDGSLNTDKISGDKDTSEDGNTSGGTEEIKKETERKQGLVFSTSYTIERYCHGYYIVSKNDGLLYGVLNQDGEEIIPVKYDSLEFLNSSFVEASICDKLYMRVKYENRYFIYDEAGNMILDKNADCITYEDWKYRYEMTQWISSDEKEKCKELSCIDYTDWKQIGEDAGWYYSQDRENHMIYIYNKRWELIQEIDYFKNINNEQVWKEESAKEAYYDYGGLPHVSVQEYWPSKKYLLLNMLTADDSMKIYRNAALYDIETGEMVAQWLDGLLAYASDAFDGGVLLNVNNQLYVAYDNGTLEELDEIPTELLLKAMEYHDSLLESICKAKYYFVFSNNTWKFLDEYGNSVYEDRYYGYDTEDECHFLKNEDNKACIIDRYGRILLDYGWLEWNGKYMYDIKFNNVAYTDDNFFASDDGAVFVINGREENQVYFFGVKDK